MKKGKFVKASHIYYYFLKIFGYVAIVNPFSLTCHVLPEYIPLGRKLKNHEETHFKQIKQDGVLKFCVKYLYYNIRYGYHKNPYEIEACAAALAPFHD